MSVIHTGRFWVQRNSQTIGWGGGGGATSWPRLLLEDVVVESRMKRKPHDVTE